MLKLRYKDNKLNAVWLVEPKVSVGRSPKNDLVVDLPEIAEHHIDIMVKHESLTLVNITESDQIKVNGESVGNSLPLQAGDEIALGNTALEIVDPKTETPKKKPSPEKPVKGSTGWALKSNQSALSNRVFQVQPLTIIGRSNECDISLGTAHLSRRHAKLTVEDGLLFVKDLGSANGTFLNGKQVTEARIKRGDLLRFDTLSFNVIGPVEDMDKTSVRRVDTAAIAMNAEAKKGAAGKPNRRVEVGGTQTKRGAKENSVTRVTAPADTGSQAKGKGLWILLAAVVIGVVAAYALGLFDSFLK